MQKKSKKSLELSFKIERSNAFNQLSPKNLSLTEIRFLAIYQAKINARNPNTRTVVFPLAEFCKIMEINQLTVTHIKRVADDIICKPVHLPSDMAKNGFMVIPLFNECQLYQDDKTFEWFVKIECHQKALPYMFEMKKNYFTYELWNALKLKSVNQIRMYEILKQYEKIGERILLIEDLRLMLGILDNQYGRYQDFRIKVLEPCQQALEQYTDIKYTFEPIRKSRKIHALKFIIIKNENFKDDLRLKEFINPKDLEDIIDVPNKSQNTDILINDVQNQDSGVNDKVMALYYELEKVYSMDELKQLLDICVGISSKPDVYLKNIYYQIKARKKKINNLFSYTLTVINADLKNSPPEEPKKKKSSSYDNTPSYDLDAYIRGLHHKYREEPFPSTQKYYFHSNEVTTFDIHTILEKNFDIYDNNLYDIRSLQGIIDYIYKKYNVLLIDVNPTGEYDKLAFGER